MAFTVAPEHYQAYFAMQMDYINNVKNNGLIQILNKTERGDAIWKYPLLSSLDSVMTTENVVTTSLNATPNTLGDYEWWMPVLHRNAGVSVHDVSNTDKGIDAWAMLKPQAPEAIWKKIQTSIASMFTGLFTTAGTLVADHQVDKTGSGALTADMIFSAPVEKLGEVGTTLDKVMLHSMKYIALKEDIESKVTTLQSGDTVVSSWLGNRQIIINDTICAKIGDNYPTYVLKGSPIKMGWEKTLSFEDEREGKLGRTDYLLWWDYALGFEGVTYGGAANPANTVLDDAASWTKVATTANIPIIQLLTT